MPIQKTDWAMLAQVVAELENDGAEVKQIVAGPAGVYVHYGRGWETREAVA